MSREEMSKVKTSHLLEADQIIRDLRRALDEIQTLHTRDLDEGLFCCECHYSWPCATRRAIPANVGGTE